MASLKASLSNGSSPSSVKLTKKSNFKTKTPNEHKSPPPGESPLTKKPRPGFCFKCGEDGHIVPSCTNEPNPEQDQRCYINIINKKENTAAINRTREKGWQESGDRLNASNLSEEKRTWQQLKIKHKNIVQNAAKIKSEIAGTGEAHQPPTPAEELALYMNKGRPVIEGIERGTSSESIPASRRNYYIKMMPNSVCFLDPPDIILNPVEGPSAVEEETVSVCSRRPEVSTPVVPTGTSSSATTVTSLRSDGHTIFSKEDI
ncbi:hypothetical protein DPEC_G00219950 [Dallia pectoralis]|uniref:Uncharacterized protein n=1 Tax=Dallia pectoralis TaxID=75939 RepID=A0ACC2G356_DALPE|nr:hypothetical protein DPEC_G00219950 [Dallia pectoralis]